MTQAKAFFRAGLKIIGVLAILWALIHIAGVIYSFFSYFNEPGLMGEALSTYRLSLLFQIAVPIVLFAIGWYLLKSESVLRFAFQDINEDIHTDIEKYFILFMKLAGLVLVVYAIPKVFQLIGNVIFITGTHGIFSGNQQIQVVTGSIVATVIELLLGFYLLGSGKLFRRIGFSETDKDQQT
ncbi:MAG TPA: hypothetical protein VFK33_02240 [Bacillales bacterium]|nr:hypothetical protein [Bacillales bacterium]